MKKYVNLFLQWVGLRDKVTVPEKGATPDIPIIRAAVHESGHAIVAAKCTVVESVDKITVDLKGGGKIFFTLSGNRPDLLWCELIMCLAGIAAEILAYGKSRSGPAAEDLTKARTIVNQLLSEGFPAPSWFRAREGPQVPFKTFFEAPLTAEEEALLQTAYVVTKGLLMVHRVEHWRLVGVIIDNPVLEGSSLESALGDRTFIRALSVFGPEFVGWY